MAGYSMSRSYLYQLGGNRLTKGGRGWAAGVEATTRRRIGERRDLALQRNEGPALGIGHRNRRQQRPRVVVGRSTEDLVDGTHLHQLAEVHHAVTGQVADDVETVADEQIRVYGEAIAVGGGSLGTIRY
jgi:hypothetical protein